MPTKYSSGEYPAFGQNQTEYSPYVLLNHTGLIEKEDFLNQVTIAVRQDLSALTKGLNIRIQGAIKNEGYRNETRFIQPSLWKATGRRPNGDLIITETKKAEPPTYSNWQRQSRTYHLEGTLDYKGSS